MKEKHGRLKPLPPDVERRLAGIPAVLARHSVRVAYLFGSVVRNPPEAGDIDLAVLPGDGFSYAALYADLSILLGTDRLDLADLRSASPLLLWEAVTTGRRLLPGAEEEYAAFERYVRSRYRDHRLVLADLERVAQELAKYQKVDAAALAGDLSLRWTVERGLLAGFTLIFQAADHILAAHFHRSADTYEGLLLELRGCGILPDHLYAQLRGSGGFRNVLVHEYVRVDLKEVEAALRRAPVVFRRFAEVVTAWLDALPAED